MNYPINEKIENFISVINKIQNSMNSFYSQLQLLWEYENSILNQITTEKRKTYIKNVDFNTVNNEKELNRDNDSNENNEEYLHKLIEKSERILNHPFIKSQLKVEELTNQKKKKTEERQYNGQKNNTNNINSKTNNSMINKKHKNNVEMNSEENLNNIKVTPEKKKIYIPSKITSKYEEHFNKLNLVYETYKNSKISMLEFRNKMTDNEENIDILIDNMDSLLQKYSYISELLMNEDLSVNHDDTLINELYSLTEMTDEIEKHILYYYNNINKTSSKLNRQWKDHLFNIEKESKNLKNNIIYYYQSLSDLLKHATICFEIQKAEIEYSIQYYLKNELIPQLDDDSLTTEEFFQYYKLLSSIIKDINITTTPIIIKK